MTVKGAYFGQAFNKSAYDAMGSGLSVRGIIEVRAGDWLMVVSAVRAVAWVVEAALLVALAVALQWTKVVKRSTVTWKLQVAVLLEIY